MCRMSLANSEFHWSGAIDSNEALVPDRRQAITWTNADPIQWRICAALGGNELKDLYATS